MTKRHYLNSLVFLFFLILLGGLTGMHCEATASSANATYRSSVSPKPAPAEAPKVAATCPADDSIQAIIPKSGGTKSAKKSKSLSSTPAPSKKSAVTAQSRTAKKKSSKTVVTKSTSNIKVAAVETSTSLTSSKKSAKLGANRSKAAASTKSKVGKKSAYRGNSKAVKAYAPAQSGTRPLRLNVKSAFLVNMSNGKVYYEQEPDKAIPPASITKLLTLYIVREAMAQGRITEDTPIPVSANAVRTGGSRMRLKRGESVPLDELIKGISVVSANNACVAVAEYMGKGNPSLFVSQMNSKARKIGMTSSQFMNPNGLPAPGQLSTARDIAKLSMSYLRTFPDSLDVHSMTSHTFHGSTHHNANSLLRTYKGVDGLKTGFVCASGYNITATAKRGNTRLVAVVLGAQNSVIRQIETAKLLDYGFKCAAMEDGLGNQASADPAVNATVPNS